MNAKALLNDISTRLSEIDEKLPTYVEKVSDCPGTGVTTEASITLKYTNIPVTIWDEALAELVRRSPYPVYKHYVTIRPSLTVTLLLD